MYSSTNFKTNLDNFCNWTNGSTNSRLYLEFHEENEVLLGRCIFYRQLLPVYTPSSLHTVRKKSAIIEITMNIYWRGGVDISMIYDFHSTPYKQLFNEFLIFTNFFLSV